MNDERVSAREQWLCLHVRVDVFTADSGQSPSSEYNGKHKVEPQSAPVHWLRKNFNESRIGERYARCDTLYYESIIALLQLHLNSETTMSLLSIVRNYPSPTIAQLIDPVQDHSSWYHSTSSSANVSSLVETSRHRIAERHVVPTSSTCRPSCSLRRD